MEDTRNAALNRHPLQVWWLAIRPKTLPAAAAPVVIGSAAAYLEGGFHWLPALAALAGALCLQIGANLANDVYDFKRGTDAGERLGPLRVTQAGLLRPGAVLAGMWLVFGVAALMGLYLALTAGWAVVWMGLACILAAIAYTGGPLPFGYLGLGDVVVFLFFGPLATCGTYYVQAGRVSPLAAWSSIPVGLLVTAILVVNNLRDIETDRRAGKRTLAVRIGVAGTRREYAACVVGAYLVVVGVVLTGIVPAWVMLSGLSLPLAFRMMRMVNLQSGRPLNQALAGTGRLTLIFALLYSAGLVLAGML
jgi:1,4-dihydroxy-2-naphthoate octaprenyltransferase